MAISIKQFNDKWRMSIEREEWEFADRKEFDKALKAILDLKEKHGQLNAVRPLQPETLVGLQGATLRPVRMMSPHGAGGDIEE